MNITPMRGKVWIIPEAENKEQQIGSIIIPESVEKGRNLGRLGEVAAVGAPELKNGKEIEIEIDIGDQVYYSYWSGTEIHHEQVEYRAILYEDIVGVVTG